MINGKRYGAESCTMFPIILTRPQLKGFIAKLVLVKFLAIKDCGNMSSRNSVPFIELDDSSATEKYTKVGTTCQLIFYVFR